MKKEGERRQEAGAESGREPSADRHPGAQASPRPGARKQEQQRLEGAM